MGNTATTPPTLQEIPPVPLCRLWGFLWGSCDPGQQPPPLATPLGLPVEVIWNIYPTVYAKNCNLEVKGKSNTKRNVPEKCGFTRNHATYCKDCSNSLTLASYKKTYLLNVQWSSKDYYSVHMSIGCYPPYHSLQIVYDSHSCHGQVLFSTLR